MNIYPNSNHYSVIGEPAYVAHIAATISESADSLFENSDVFTFSIEDYRKGSLEARGRKALEWMENYYTTVRCSALSIATLADILYNILLENNYILSPDEKKEGGA